MITLFMARVSMKNTSPPTLRLLSPIADSRVMPDSTLSVAAAMTTPVLFHGRNPCRIVSTRNEDLRSTRKSSVVKDRNVRESRAEVRR
jgi:hypothetical protein